MEYLSHCVWMVVNAFVVNFRGYYDFAKISYGKNALLSGHVQF